MLLYPGRGCQTYTQQWEEEAVKNEEIYYDVCSCVTNLTICDKKDHLKQKIIFEFGIQDKALILSFTVNFTGIQYDLPNQSYVALTY